MLLHGHEVLIDDDDIQRVSEKSWQLFNLRKNDLYFIHRVRENGKVVKTIFLHRFIMGITDPKVYVDHKNGNKLDNRKSNLRPCSKADNQRNCRMNGRNKTGYKGVYRERGKFKANVTINGVTKFVAYKQTAYEAHLAYCRAALKYYGEFANFDCKCHPDNKLLEGEQ